MYNQKRRFLAFIFFRNVNTIAKNLASLFGRGFLHYFDRCEMLSSLFIYLSITILLVSVVSLVSVVKFFNSTVSKTAFHG